MSPHEENEETKGLSVYNLNVCLVMATTDRPTHTENSSSFGAAILHIVANDCPIASFHPDLTTCPLLL